MKYYIWFTLDLIYATEIKNYIEILEITRYVTFQLLSSVFYKWTEEEPDKIDVDNDKLNRI